MAKGSLAPEVAVSSGRLEVVKLLLLVSTPKTFTPSYEKRNQLGHG